MIKIMKRKVRSLAFLLLITVAGIGLSGALSFAAPNVGQASDNKAKTRSHPRSGGSAKKAPSVCRKRCDENRAACLTSIITFQCEPAHDQCLEKCKR
jgi:predicted small lipoprotein YifL